MLLLLFSSCCAASIRVETFVFFSFCQLIFRAFGSGPTFLGPTGRLISLERRRRRSIWRDGRKADAGRNGR